MTFSVEAEDFNAAIKKAEEKARKKITFKGASVNDLEIEAVGVFKGEESE